MTLIINIAPEGNVMRNIVVFTFLLIFASLVIGCGDEEDEAEIPTTGTVSGTVTFVGTPPEDIAEISVSIFSNLDEQGRPFGPPDRYSDPFTQFTGSVPYKISGVIFGTYKLAAVGYKPSNLPIGTAQTILGMYGFNAPSDTSPDSFTVSQDQPDITGIDIVASYAMIKSMQP